MTRHDAQGRSPDPLQHPLWGCPDTTRQKGPRAQANHCMLPPGLVFPVIHPTQHHSLLFLLSRAVVLPAWVWLKWIHKVAFWLEREVSHGQYLLHTCLLIQPETWFYDLPYCLLIQAPTASRANFPNQISSKCPLYIQHPENKASFTTRIKLAQKQVNMCFPEKNLDAYTSYHHSPHFP